MSLHIQNSVPAGLIAMSIIITVKETQSRFTCVLAEQSLGEQGCFGGHARAGCRIVYVQKGTSAWFLT